MSDELIEAKQRLLEKLGPNYDLYIKLLGKWFRGLISKDEFDKSAKQLIQTNFVIEHNKFWLRFFHHCANSATHHHLHSHHHNHQFHHHHHNHMHIDGPNCYGQDNSYGHYGEHINHHDQQKSFSPDSISISQSNHFMSNQNCFTNYKCLPNKIMTHMKVFVIAWEMELDSADDQVSLYVSLALRYFLKNIITELITTKTAYRLRENRFKYAIGIKPINPYLNNSFKIYSSNLEYDPYQIESNKMNSSLVDTYAYNDSLFPSRLYEAQALYEYACSTTSVTANKPALNCESSPNQIDRIKKIKLANLFSSREENDELEEVTKCLAEEMDVQSILQEGNLVNDNREYANEIYNNHGDGSQLLAHKLDVEDRNDVIDRDEDEKEGVGETKVKETKERRLTLYHLLIAFLSNKSIMPQDQYSINIERIFAKLS